MTTTQPRAIWTREEEKNFESALAHYRDNPNALEKITADCPGKLVADLKQHFRDQVHDVGFFQLSLSNEDAKHFFRDVESASSLQSVQLQHNGAINHNKMAVWAKGLSNREGEKEGAEARAALQEEKQTMD
ncbi:hypothetical protein Ancab_034252 [Ancistrocladus abbreviatus]